MKKIKIGLPKALLYYKYNVLWRTFFEELGFEVVESVNTNNEIIETGKKLTVDEACLSLKIFMGHVNYLVDKVDYILVPRIVCLKKGEKTCTNFYALYDLVNNTVKAKILDYNIDMDKNISEEDAFFYLGKKLNIPKSKVEDAYKKAKIEEYKQNKKRYLLEIEKLNSKKIKVLVVSHAYNMNDNFVGKNIEKILKDFNCEVIHCDVLDPDNDSNLHENISKSVYWTYNIDLLNMIEVYKNSVDGILLLTTFPCGPDSLVNEMIISKIKKPLITILIDDISSFEGFKTRIESFIDIIGGYNFEQ